MVENSGSFVISAELPGLTEEDVEVKAASGMITIKGEKSEETVEDDTDHHISERRFGKFQRTFRMPEGVDSSKIDASMSRGVLKVTLPKTKEAMSAERKITVSKG
jgi:HSP20 family protein